MCYWQYCLKANYKDRKCADYRKQCSAHIFASLYGTMNGWLSIIKSHNIQTKNSAPEMCDINRLFCVKNYTGLYNSNKGLGLSIVSSFVHYSAWKFVMGLCDLFADTILKPCPLFVQCIYFEWQLQIYST